MARKKLVNKFVYDRQHPVAIAVEPQKVDAIKQAEDWAIAYIAVAKAKLIECEWNINAAAPYPVKGDGMFTEMAKREKRAFYRSITKARKVDVYQPYSETEPRYVDWDAPASNVFIHQQCQKAADRYDMFVYKLVNKIGPCNTATLEGNHVWGFSILTVTKHVGTIAAVIERWKTQQIENRSKYDLQFAQWPSRLMKPGSK